MELKIEIPTTCLLRVVVMPNNEVLHMGRTIGFIKQGQVVYDSCDDGEYGGLLIEKMYE